MQTLQIMDHDQKTYTTVFMLDPEYRFVCKETRG